MSKRTVFEAAATSALAVSSHVTRTVTVLRFNPMGSVAGGTGLSVTVLVTWNEAASEEVTAASKTLRLDTVVAPE